MSRLSELTLKFHLDYILGIPQQFSLFEDHLGKDIFIKTLQRFSLSPFSPPTLHREWNTQRFAEMSFTLSSMNNNHNLGWRLVSILSTTM